MAFPFFLLLNFILFIRPEELYPPIAGARLYYCTFLACIIFSWRELSANLRLNRLLEEPITCCIILYGLIYTLSNVINLTLYEAREHAIDFLKLFFYYMLFISLVNTPERLRTFMKALVFFIFLLSCLVLLDHYELLQIEAISPVMQNEYDENGAIIDTYPRLVYLGFFQDPNDLSMILGVGMLITFYFYWTGASILRVLWALPFACFGFLMVLTQSRGGLLGLAAGIAAFFASRLGWRKALPMALLAIPALLFTVGGRQANLSLSGGTAQERLQIWSDGLILMAQPRSMLIGIGAGRYEEEVGHVAHNSYVHAFVETGLLGGTIFAGMFLLGFGVVFRQSSPWFSYYQPVLARMHPFLLAVFADYLMCMFSLTRNYVVTTYMILAMMTAFLRMAQDENERAWFKMRVRMLLIIGGLGLSVYMVLKLFLMSFVQFGGH